MKEIKDTKHPLLRKDTSFTIDMVSNEEARWYIRHRAEATQDVKNSLLLDIDMFESLVAQVGCEVIDSNIAFLAFGEKVEQENMRPETARRCYLTLAFDIHDRDDVPDGTVLPQMSLYMRWHKGQKWYQITKGWDKSPGEVYMQYAEFSGRVKELFEIHAHKLKYHPELLAAEMEEDFNEQRKRSERGFRSLAKIANDLKPGLIQVEPAQIIPFKR
jgi:hypothetical protein